MDTLFVEGFNESFELFKFDPQSTPNFLGNQQNYVNGVIQDQPFQDLVQPDPFPSTEPNQKINPAPCSSVTSDGDAFQVPDFPDDCLNFMNEILMEEDLDDKLGTFLDYSAIKATEKALYDVLGEVPLPSDQFPSSHSQYVANPDDDFERSSSSHGAKSYCTGKPAADLACIQSHGGETSTLDGNSLTSPLESNSHSSSSSSTVLGDAVQNLSLPASLVDIPLVPMLDNEGEFDWFTEAIKYVPESCTCISETGGNQILKEKHDEVAGEAARRDKLVDGSKGRKTHQRDESDCQENVRSNKLLAAYDDDYVQMEQYDDVLLWKEWKDDCPKASVKLKQTGSNSKSSRGRRSRGKKQIQEEVVDLGSLLILCAQAVSSFDMRNANELLKQIRQHSSRYGDSMERIAHYFVYGLEARIAGTGSHLYIDTVLDNHIPTSDVLKAYRTYVEAVPLRRTSYYLANQTIAKLAENATTIHIIDFGIFLGFQWPCFIQCLSKRANGPPKLRITGIGFPQRGFKPAASIEETGKRLEGYCKRFNVPFEYNAIAKKWDALSSDDIKVNSDELVVVNCMYESRALFDETVEEDSPRDAFLRLIRSLNPDIFVHGIISSALNAPFFLTRFKEALFHYSTIFDMLEATIPREDPERLLMEGQLYGKAALNVIGYEGVERLERPETYKQWQVRTLRAGFKQFPLDRGLVSLVKEKVKANYHKDFVVGEDARWMVQGWKGRILYAMSFWRPS